MSTFTAAQARRCDKSLVDLDRISAMQNLKDAPCSFSYAIASDCTTAKAAFTAPYPLHIDDIILNTTVGEASNTIKVLKATTEMCTALVATSDGLVSHMVAGATAATAAQRTLATGDVVNVQAAGGSNGANQRGLITFIGHRV